MDETMDRLPPPVFPTGSTRRRWAHAARPDAREAVPLGDALIQPDEPFPHRGQAPSEADVVVTGIGDDPHLAQERWAGESWTHEQEQEPQVRAPAVPDPHLGRLVQMVGSLAHALRDEGEAGLRAAPGMSRFETTLRAYCVGWLAARREGEGG